MAKSSAAPAADLDERFTVNSFACGCLIRSEFENGAGQKWISYCALHRNAQALYEALSAAIRFNHHHDYCGAEDMTHPTPCVCGATTAVLQARAALALADAAQGEK